MAEKNPLLMPAATAAAMLAATYEWLDRVDAAGGCTSISGVASCNAFLESLRKERKRAEKLVIAPLREALEANQ